MPTPRRKVELLQRLSRLREVEKLRAAQAAAQAQGVHHKLLDLQQRSQDIAHQLAARNDAETGADLAHRLRFADGLDAIRRRAAGETHVAAALAREAISDWQQADVRHDRVEDRLLAQRRAMEKSEISSESTSLARKLKSTS